ncbi:MAG: serine O-acetyltransferase [Bacillota bacterium]
MWATLRRDIRAIFERDPAVKSLAEAVSCYPGLHALVLHRAAHWLYRRGLVLAARLLSHISRFLTGVEIHPGARIGPGCFIDHGLGVVIGETADIGEDVTLYQGAVLGGTGKATGKRHPTVRRGATIAAGAIVLGNITVGEGARVGAGAVVIRDVPDHATVVGVPGRVVAVFGRAVGAGDLEHGNLPDPLDQQLRRLQERIEALEEAVKRGRREDLA